jgi:WD40 repeat protein
VVTGLPLGPLLPHSAKINAVAFARDGTKAVTGSFDRTARLWRFGPGSAEGDSERINLWTQVMTGLELDSNDGIRELTPRTWRERGQRLHELGGPPDSPQRHGEHRAEPRSVFSVSLW